jgi:hypothetical protein
MAQKKVKTKIVSKKDSYSPPEAGRVLGLSPRRIRQLAEADQLEATQWSPLRVSQESVIRLRSTKGVKVDRQQTKQTPELELLKQALDQLKASQELLVRQLTTGREIEQVKEQNYLQQIAELKSELERAQTRKLFRRKR